MIGITIRKLITTESRLLSAQISTRMMKLNTGTLRIARITGESRSARTGHAPAPAASPAPTTTARTKPSTIRPKE